jgi:hypothetical protein
MKPDDLIRAIEPGRAGNGRFGAKVNKTTSAQRKAQLEPPFPLSRAPGDAVRALRSACLGTFNCRRRPDGKCATNSSDGSSQSRGNT